MSELGKPTDEDVFEVVSTTRIVDLRNVTLGSRQRAGSGGPSYVYRRLVVRKKLHDLERTHLRLRLTSRTPELRCTSIDRVPVLRRPAQAGLAKDGEELWTWEVDLDLADVPIGGTVTLEVDEFDPRELHRSGKEWVHYPVSQSADFAAMWILLPEGRTVEDFDIVSYEPDDRDGAEIVEPTSQVTLYGGTVIHWTVIDPDETRDYECRLYWK